MHTFRTLDAQIGMVPGPMTVALRSVDQSQGSERAFGLQHPEALKTLIQIARIQSVESSNAIEDITAPHARVVELVEQKTAPENRSEAEIAGYRAALDAIHASALQIPLKPSVVEQLHRDLYQFTGVRAGHWKTVDNSIEEVRPDGTRFVRFRTLSAVETTAAMVELHELFGRAMRSGDYHPLLLAGCYVFDFLAIHPFLDGNGRMGRLLTLLLLYQAGYEVGRYVSLERLVQDSSDAHYEAVGAAGIGWHTGEHDITPWLEYFLGIVAAAYKEFESRVGVVAGRGSKREAIRQFVRQSIAEEFTVADVRRAAPAASQSYISKTLASMRDEGVIEPIGAGKTARWRRLRSEF
jgi:Fic family protein